MFVAESRPTSARSRSDRLVLTSAHRAVGSASSFSSATSDFSSAARSVSSTYGSPPRADASPAVPVMPTRSTFESNSASSLSRSGDSGAAIAEEFSVRAVEGKIFTQLRRL